MKNAFLGPRRIVRMSNWVQDSVNMEGLGCINFETHQFGSFHFGFVQGQIGYALESSREEFGRPLRRFLARHAKRGALLRRLTDAGLWSR